MFLELVIVFLLAILVILTKAYFYFVEKSLIFSLPFFMDWISIFIFVFLILHYFRKEREKISPQKNTFEWKFFVRDKKIIFVSLLILFFISLSFFINIKKQALDWDAVALYDARAKFLMNGLNFKDMVDMFGGYYVMYPPFTSIIHYFWHTLFSFLNVSLFYSLNLLVLAFLVFVLTSKELGIFLSLILTFITVSNSKVFFLSTIEYTNLPFAVFITGGIFFLIRFLKSSNYFYLTGGFFLLALSQWVRFLDPIAFVIGVSFALSLFLNKIGKRSSFLFVLFFFFLVFLQRYLWQLIINGYFGLENNSFPLDIYLKAISGIFDGSFMEVLFYFLNNRYFGILLPIYLLSASSIFNKKEIVSTFLFLIILSSLLLFLFGLYFYYFKLPNWRDIADSAARLSIYLIPVSIYLILHRLKVFMRTK